MPGWTRRQLEMPIPGSFAAPICDPHAAPEPGVRGWHRSLALGWPHSALRALGDGRCTPVSPQGISISLPAQGGRWQAGLGQGGLSGFSTH